MRRLLFFLVSYFVTATVACSTNSDCGSVDDSAPGLCQAGICQCGVGYSGNVAVDPTLCSLVCTPEPVPDVAGFLREPNVTITAEQGSMVLDVGMEPYAKQMPATVALCHPRNESLTCVLMSKQLGSGRWSQEIGYETCSLRNVFRAPLAEMFDPTGCFEELEPTTDATTGVTYRHYRTTSQVVQRGLAPASQASSNRDVSATPFELASRFRAVHQISVASQVALKQRRIAHESPVSCRIVSIDYLQKEVRLTIMTRSQIAIKSLSVVAKRSRLLPTITSGPASMGPCAVGSLAQNRCDQLFSLGFAIQQPCKVEKALLALAADLASGETGISLLPLPVAYNTCPVESTSKVNVF